MAVYIEYAFLENFLFDFALLTLAFLLCRTKIVWWKIVISSILGGIFAIAYPLLALPEVLLFILKIGVGFLLCLIPFPHIKNKKDGGRYALNVGVFFFLTFLYGGALTALFSAIFPQKTPVFWVALGFAVLSYLSIIIIRKVYQKRTVFQYIYPCEILYGKRVVAVLGYLDSGNLASKNGLSVCFLSPDVFYDIFVNEQCNEREKSMGQVCDEMVISTMAGERKIKLFSARLEVEISPTEKIKTQVYFCPSKNMINREYKLLLNARIFNGLNSQKTQET